MRGCGGGFGMKGQREGEGVGRGGGIQEISVTHMLESGHAQLLFHKIFVDRHLLSVFFPGG